MIIKCTACGHDVSDKAIRCNKCGEPTNIEVAAEAVAKFSIPKTTLIIMIATMLMGLFFSYREIKQNKELAKYASYKIEMWNQMNEMRMKSNEMWMDLLGF